jgi:hypothetical protein
MGFGMLEGAGGSKGWYICGLLVVGGGGVVVEKRSGLMKRMETGRGGRGEGRM